MERRAGLDALRASVEERYDRLYSPTFDDDAPISSTHLRFVERVTQSCPPRGVILDAPCGTGRYPEKVLAAGRTVVGIDQAAGSWPARGQSTPRSCSRNSACRNRGLALGSRQLSQGGARPWTHLPDHRAGRRGGDRERLRRGQGRRAADRVRREPSARGYHYPSLDRGSEWLEDEGLEIIDEGVSRGRTYSYLHLLVQ